MRSSSTGPRSPTRASTDPSGARSPTHSPRTRRDRHRPSWGRVDVNERDDAERPVPAGGDDVPLRVDDSAGIARPMRVDLVAAPARYPRAPLLMLVVLGLVPVVLLTVLALCSDEQADTYEAARQAADSDTGSDGPASADSGDGPSVATPLVTPLIDYRRTPRQIVVVSDANRLADAMAPMMTFVGDESCVAVSVDGRLVTARNAATPVIPASTQKLLVAAVALEGLGPEYRFTTTVSALPAVDGVIDGDLFLVGGGDPLLTADDFPIADDRYPAFATTSLDRLADAVVGSGVTTVRGSVVGDGTRYDDQWVIASWADGVALVDAGPYDALLVNDARILGRSSRQNDPNEAAAREFVRLLQARGVQVNGGWESGVADPAAQPIGSVESAPLSTVVAEMLTTSDNDTAEMLVKEVGVADSGQGTLAGGLNVIDRTLRAWGVPMDGVRLVDGSGLSASNRVTCAALLAVLDRASATALREGLPVAGRTGTLAEEFLGSPMEGRMVAKTGTLGNPPADEQPPAVKALAGYLDASDGRTLGFALVQTGPDITEEERYRALWLALGDRLATYPAGADMEAVGPR